MKRATVALALVVTAFSASSALAADACSVSLPVKFDNASKLLTVDLSGVPKDTQVFRAHLVLNGLQQFQARPTTPTKVYPDGQPDKPLKFVAPRFVSLDALEAVRAAMKDGKPLTLKLECTLSGAKALELSFVGGKAKGEIPTTGNVKVAHRAGQSLITFTEPKLADFPEFKTGEDVSKFKAQLLKDHPGMTFRIWRSAEKITSASIDKAELVGEIGLLTAWNSSRYQGETGKNPALRYRVTDGGEEVPWGTGIYAHNPPKAGKAFYAVSVAVNGEEDFSKLSAANTTAAAIDETVGLGEPVFQVMTTPASYNYRRANKGYQMICLYYTRWESGPHSSTPSNPIDYVVAMTDEPMPEKLPARELQYQAYRVEPAPVGLHLHCWGANLDGGYYWWYRAHLGSILIASNQVPYDWWTGYHEANGTNRTYGDGVVQPFTMTRMMSFLDWAAKQHEQAPQAIRKYWMKLDLRRVFVSGMSMGGAGAPMYALRFGDRVAMAQGMVGIHIPAESPQFTGSYQGSYGARNEAITMPDGKTSPWDYFNDVWWMQNNVKAETGFIIASNGKNDGGIGWPQAYKFARALQETRRPHVYNWGLGGHLTGPLAEFTELDVRNDQTLPAFTNGSLDDDIGTGKAKSKEEIEADKKQQEEEKAAGKRKDIAVCPVDGAPVGAYNAHLWWDTKDVVDTPTAWEMTVILKKNTKADSCKVDLTPRRCQQFKTPKGAKCKYTVTGPDGKTLAQGEATADEYDLITLKQIPLVLGNNRVKIQKQ